MGRRHFRRFFTPNEQHKPPSCLTRVSGTRSRAPTARALAPAASASTRLVSSASTTSTCAVSAPREGQGHWLHQVPLNDRNEICRGGTLGGGYSTAGKVAMERKATRTSILGFGLRSYLACWT